MNPHKPIEMGTQVDSAPLCQKTEPYFYAVNKDLSLFFIYFFYIKKNLSLYFSIVVVVPNK